MLVRGFKRLVPFIAPTLIILFLVVNFWGPERLGLQFQGKQNPGTGSFALGDNVQYPDPNSLEDFTKVSPVDALGAFGGDGRVLKGGVGGGSSESSTPADLTISPSGKTLQPPEDSQDLPENSIGNNTDSSIPIDIEDSISGNSNIEATHRQIFSLTTTTKTYFPISFAPYKAINPNIIPHPTLLDVWIIVAQKKNDPKSNSAWNAELVCNAAFENGTLKCIEPPVILPIAATFGDKCTGELEYYGNNVGPHDARVFYGPKKPYTTYGSNSAFTCWGQWVQDFRYLVDWGMDASTDEAFLKPVDLQRPEPYGFLEKNWFIFWDTNEQKYLHYDMSPKRVFSKLKEDGSIGEDLAPLAAANDEKCMDKYMPRLAPEDESIHQATNSLLITLCKRSDESCEVNESNTFVFTIFQHKSFHDWHGLYEPYIMLFQQTAPFEIYGLSMKPIWINGRGREGTKKKPNFMGVEDVKSRNHTEMMYVTSFSWKTQGQKYHGYLDDVLFLGFGIEDDATGGIDVKARDLLQDIGLCSSV